LGTYVGPTMGNGIGNNGNVNGNVTRYPGLHTDGGALLMAKTFATRRNLKSICKRIRNAYYRKGHMLQNPIFAISKGIQKYVEFRNHPILREFAYPYDAL
jgi:hypothetical protein